MESESLFSKHIAGSTEKQQESEGINQMDCAIPVITLLGELLTKTAHPGQVQQEPLA